MRAFTMTATTTMGYDATLAAVRRELVEAGFGVLTEIDIRATLKAKLDVDVPAQVILGACRPQLAHQAIEAIPSIAALLPCNVVVRDTGDAVVVEAVDPDMMMSVAGDDPTLAMVAADARTRLSAVLDAVNSLEDEGAR